MTFAQIPAAAAVFLDAKLTLHVQAVAQVPLLGIQTVAITQPLVGAATLASQQFELLTGDALVVAVMQANGLTHLASNDADFDRVPWLMRYETRP